MERKLGIKSGAAAGTLVVMLSLTACGGGTATEGGNAMAGLETSTTGSDPNQNLTIGEDMGIPSDWPKEVPVFMTGSLVTVGVNPDGGADASWSTSASSEDVASEYEKALKAAGYTLVSGSEITGVEGISGADYTGDAYAVNMLVSTTDGATTLFVTATPA